MTYTIIAVNVVIFVFEAAMSKEQLQVFFELVAVIPAEYVGFMRGEPVPILKLLFAPFASMFLHGGWMHLFGNMWFLYLFGDNVEDSMGHSRFLLFYLLSGLAATFAHIFVNPNSTVPIVGASGAISGVVGAYFLMFPTARVLTLVPIFFFVDIVLLPAVVFIGLWFLFQFWSGLLSLAVPHLGGVAWWAHIGGFVAGLILAPILRGRQRPTRYRIRVHHRYW